MTARADTERAPTSPATDISRRVIIGAGMVVGVLMAAGVVWQVVAAPWSADGAAAARATPPAPVQPIGAWPGLGQAGD
jgi:hypothetical protein